MVDGETDIALDLLDYHDFKHALISMGLDDDDIDRLSAESGRSLTDLRRRLSPNTAIRTPLWAGRQLNCEITYSNGIDLVPWHTGLGSRSQYPLYARRQQIRDDWNRILHACAVADDSPCVVSRTMLCGVELQRSTLYSQCRNGDSI